MSRNRMAKSVAVAAGFLFVWMAPTLSHGQSAPASPVQTPKVSHPTQRKVDPQDDFAGLNYTDEQKAEIEKIRQDTRAHKDVVAKDQTLSPDQKDAMILGYTRMEYGMVYKVLTPEQKREVRQRINARQAAEQAAKRKQPPQN